MKLQQSLSTQSNQGKQFRNTQGRKLLITVIALFVWLIVYVQFVKSHEYRSTRLIMQSAGCHYVELHNIPTHAYSVPDTCSVTASYRPDVFGQGGVILQGETYIELADNQIMVAEVLQEQPWTEPQISAAKWFGLASLVLIGLIAVLFL